MKVLCILYDDPKGGMPSSYPVETLPKIEKYPDGQTLPTPKGIDFNLKSGSIFSIDLTALLITVKVLNPRKSNLIRPLSSTSYISN
jgi:hypothetical protein